MSRTLDFFRHDALAIAAIGIFLCIDPHEAVNPSLGNNTHVFSTQTRFGVQVVWNTPALGQTRFAGSWAYTAA
ncbi:hypothetical protein [Nocardioides sp.]|uniref:hypothetical protein n=1 Tax=Nocardioides sp. TaxID=35761 RepID=UPI00272002FE|nr:hypothetical protein [Nocardioides sp.]MDO9454488.1 hypothetical protein [Nocardioides sp.]